MTAMESDDATVFRKADAPAEEKTIGKYVVETVLGKGAMGTVYRAFDPVIRRNVAIKLINRYLLADDDSAEIRGRFQREAQAAGQLSSCKNIVTVHDFGEQDGSPYIVMEFVEGETLRQSIQAGKKYGLDETLHIMHQLLEGLEFSHSRKVVHRDIKPDNIFLLRDGPLKIADFGIAKLSQVDAEQTRHSGPLGTPSYMSPEQVLGQDVDSRSDLFSAGVILYQLLTGNKPFPGENATLVMKQVIDLDPPDVSTVNPGLPRPLDALVRKALAKDPAKRFQTAREFSTALRQVEEEARTTPSRRPSRLPMLGGASVVALALAAYGVWQISHREPAPLEVRSSAPSLPSAPAIPAPEKAAPTPPRPVPPADREKAPLPLFPQTEESIKRALTGIGGEGGDAVLPAEPELAPGTREEGPPTQQAPPAPVPKSISFEARASFLTAGGRSKELLDGVTLTPRDSYSVTFKADETVYLYIAQIDSQGGIYSIFPNPEYSVLRNPVAGGALHGFPEASRLYLDENVGKENIYYLVSPQALKGLDSLFGTLATADDASRELLARQFLDVYASHPDANKRNIWFRHEK